MIRRFFNQYISPKKKLLTLESYLDERMKAVSPRPEFVNQLREKIIGKQKKSIFSFRALKKENYLIVFGIIASIGLVMIAGIRAITTILGALGVLQVSKQSTRKRVQMRHTPAV